MKMIRFSELLLLLLKETHPQQTLPKKHDVYYSFKKEILLNIS